MNRLEIIHLRFTGTCPPGLVEKIRRSIPGDMLANIRIYHHAALTTDLAIHLHHEAVASAPRISELGVHLASALREYGMVEHSNWIEERP